MMHSIYCLLFLILALPTLLITDVQAEGQFYAQLENKPQKVIFFGNSFTYFNNSLHYHLERMVRANTPKEDFQHYDFRAVTISGGTLAEHQDTVPALLALEPWDAVILQGHSRESIDDEMSPVFREVVNEMVATTRELGGTALLFMTWAYQHKPEMLESVSQAYTALGRELGVPVVPVGLAFQRALTQYPDIKLYASDKVHPSPAGTYLAACTFYAVLYGESPVGNPYNMWLKPEQAAQLQEIAQETVQQYQQPLILNQVEDKMLVYLMDAQNPASHTKPTNRPQPHRLSAPPATDKG